MRKPNVILIGMFVIGAFALVMTGVAILGAGRLFTRHPTYVMHFEGSVKGLSIGAPVVFKGVKVGKVSRIGLQYDPKTGLVRIVVLSQISLNSITRPGGEKVTQAFFQKLIRQGLKAQLQYENYVTGQLLIDLDFYPGRKVRLAGAYLSYPEIPTTPSSLEELSKAVEKVPIDELVAKMASTVDSIAEVASSPELRQAVSSMNLTAREMGSLTRKLNESMDPLLADTRAAMRDTRKLLRRLDSQSSTLQARVDKTLDATLSTMERTERLLASLDHAGAGGQPMVMQLSESLEKASDAADSLKALADYLGRHPEALVRGKRAEE